MRRARQSAPRTAADYLALALRTSSPDHRERYARAGLGAGEEDGDVLFGLQRQLYLAHLARAELDDAVRAITPATCPREVRDLAHHDIARAQSARGDLRSAIAAQRLASRVAPASRRSFHLWSLATLLQFDRQFDEALRVLKRAELWAHRDGPLLRAQSAYARLEAGKPVARLGEIIGRLQRSRCREGYGQFLLGMLAEHLGDRRRATLHLQAFLRRNASAKAEKVLTLREEIGRARRALARTAD